MSILSLVLRRRADDWYDGSASGIVGRRRRGYFKAFVFFVCFSSIRFFSLYLRLPGAKSCEEGGICNGRARSESRTMILPVGSSGCVL
jgi:hypothetical protein